MVSIVLIIFTIIFLWLLFFVCNKDDGLVLGVIALIMASFIFFVSIKNFFGIVVSGLILIGDILLLLIWRRKS